MGKKERYSALFEGRRVELVEGTVTWIDIELNRMTVRLEKTTVEGGLDCTIPLNGNRRGENGPCGPLGFGFTKGSEATGTLEGRMKTYPRRGQKVLMIVLFTGESGFVVLRWTLKELVESIHRVNALMYSVVDFIEITGG